MSRMCAAPGEAGSGGATPPLPAAAAPASTSASSAATARDGSEAAQGRWHSMSVPERTRVQLPAGVGRASRGLRQRRRAAARPGLPARGRRARLRPFAGARREARLLALAVALPRRRRHLPAERQRRRGVRAGRPARGRRRATARDRRLARQLDGRVVHEHAWPLDAQSGGPARHRLENRVELLVGALLDSDLPALSLELDEVGAGERDEVADELGRGGRRRRLDGDGADWRLPRRRRSLEGSSAPVGRLKPSRRARAPRRGRPGPRRAPRG